MPKRLAIAYPGDDLSDEAALTPIRPRAAGAQAIFLLGTDAARSGCNRVKGGVPGAMSGTPVAYGSGFVRFNGEEGANQSRLDTRIKQSLTNTLYAAYRPASPTIDPEAQPVVWSTGLGFALNNQNEAGNRTSNGIALWTSQAGYLSLSVATYNPTTETALPIVFALTGIDYTIWHDFVVTIGPTLVTIDDLTTGAHAERTVTAGYVIDPNGSSIIWGDSAGTQTVRDGIGDHGVAAIFNELHSADDRAATHAQFRERQRLASPSIDL